MLMSDKQYIRREREFIKLQEETRIAEKIRQAEETVRRGDLRTGSLRLLINERPLE